MMRIPTCLYILLSFGIVTFGMGCMGTTPEAQYYTLSSSSEPLERPMGDSFARLAIGLGPISFPDELNRPSIVTRSSKNRLEVNEFHRWGGSLERNFTQVMIDNLTLLLKTDQIMRRPWERFFSPDYRITLNIRQLDGQVGEYASLKATWMIFGKKMDKPHVIRRSTIREPVNGDDFDSFVAAQSKAVFKLSSEIAASLAEVVAGK